MNLIVAAILALAEAYGPSALRNIPFLTSHFLNQDLLLKCQYFPSTGCSKKREKAFGELTELFEKGADINTQDPWQNNKTPLMYALDRGDRELTNFLLERYPDLTKVDDERNTVFHYAAVKNRYGIEGEINARDFLYRLISYCSARTSHHLTTLLNQPNKEDKTVLSYVIKNSSDLSLALTLAEQFSAKPTRTDLNQALHSHFLGRQRAADIIEFLLPRFFSREDLLHADAQHPLLSGDGSLVVRMANIYSSSSDGHIKRKYLRILQTLLTCGTSPDELHQYEGCPLRPALHSIASTDNEEIANKLLVYGGLKDIIDGEGKTALHHAAIEGNTAMVKLLVSYEGRPVGEQE